MERIWLNHYPEGVPHTIDPDQYKSLSHFYDDTLKTYAQHPFSTCMGVTHTYQDVDRLSKTVAAWLQKSNIAKSDVIAVMLPNVPQYLPVLIGIIRAGYTCTPINPLYTDRELKHQLNDSGAKAIFIIENFCHELAQMLPQTQLEHIVVSKMGDLLGGVKGLLVNTVVKHVKKMVPSYHFSGKAKITTLKHVLKKGSKLEYKPIAQQNSDVAFLQYTGGTTGLAKGAILTHRHVVAAALAAESWFGPATKKLHGKPATLVMALPLYHIFAYMLSLLGAKSGYRFLLIPNPRDMEGFVKTLSQEPFHIFPGVNTLFNGLLKSKGFDELDFSNLIITQSGGMAASPATAKRWLSTTGTPIIEGWGMTECVGIGSDNPVTNTEFTGTIGLPVPSMDIAVRDDDDKEVGIGEAGELCIKGPNVIDGYHNKADKSGDFTHDGYFRTGDIVSVSNEGHITILDRKKDMILVSGFNVYPNELEATIGDCEGVAECAAIGVPSESQGEAIKLFVVKSDAKLNEDTVRAFCKENFTGYKQPRDVVFIDELPKTAVGKIQKQELRAM